MFLWIKDQIENGLIFIGEETKSNEVCSTLEKELELIHKALDGKVGSSKEEKDAFLREFSKLRITSQEQLNTAQQEKRRLKQVWPMERECV